MNFVTLIVLATLSLFGVWYSWFIFLHPIKRTWLSVVIGTGANAVACFIIIYTETDRLFAALTPFICLVVSGGPMIVGQEMKAYHTRQLAANIKNGLAAEEN